MPRQTDKTRRLNVAYLLLAAATLGSGGCLAVVAGAAAAGGAATYFYVNGKVCQEYVATFNNTWFAAQAALKDLGYTLVANENDGKEGKLVCTGPDGKPKITLDLETQPSPIPNEGVVTRVCVRVGHFFGDKAVSERILAQVGAHLVAPVPTAGGPPTWTSSPGGPIRPVSAAGPPETAEPPAAKGLPLEPVPVKPGP